VRLEESLPGRLPTSLGGGLETGVRQDALDRISADVVADVEQCAANAGVSPAGVVSLSWLLFASAAASRRNS
jgi:hypothetical protein